MYGTIMSLVSYPAFSSATQEGHKALNNKTKTKHRASVKNGSNNKL